MSNQGHFNPFPLLPINHGIFNDTAISGPFPLLPINHGIFDDTAISGPPPKMAKTDRAPSAKCLRPSDAIEIKCGPEKIEQLPKQKFIKSKDATGVDRSSETVTTVSSSTTSAQKTERSSSSSVNLVQTERSKGDVLCPELSSKGGAYDRAGTQLAAMKDTSAPKVLSFKLRSYCPNKDESQKNPHGPSLPMIRPHSQVSRHNGPAIDVIWKGSFEIFHTKEDIRFCEGILAHPSAKVSERAFEFSKQISGDMMFVMLPRSRVWPKAFDVESPDRNDIALYFYPGHFERSKRQYASLLKFIEKQDLVLRSRMVKVDLLVFPSRLLDADSQQLNGSYFLWGVFSCKKNEAVAERAHFSSVPTS